jgi:hypothetical protein
LTFYEFIDNFLDSKNGFVLDSLQFKGTRFLLIPEFFDSNHSTESPEKTIESIFLNPVSLPETGFFISMALPMKRRQGLARLFIAEA